MASGGYNLAIPNGETAPGPAEHGFAITPSDSQNLPKATKAVYVGGTGDLEVIFNGDGTTTTLFQSVPAGTVLPISVSAVKLTGTTATKLVGMA